MGALARKDRLIILLAVAATVLSGALTAVSGNAVLIFVISGVALAALAALVGSATEQLGGWLGPGATGVLQSALGNLPELFFGVFALRAGLITVVQATIVGSILGNNLLVLGLAFLIGGLRHGTQRFASEQPRMIVTLMLLAVAALVVPTLALNLHTPASGHIDALSVASAIVLLAVFVASIPISLGGGPASVSSPTAEAHVAAWPLRLAAGMLILASIGAAFVADWFVGALTPAITTLHISEAFTGLVIVAVAGNAVEHVVGVQFAAANKPDYALSIILNSPLQIAIGLTPVLVLLSFLIGSTHLTLALPPLQIAALGLSVAASTVIVYDGESIWLEGLALIGLYVILAVSFWWG